GGCYEKHAYTCRHHHSGGMRANPPDPTDYKSVRQGSPDSPVVFSASIGETLDEVLQELEPTPRNGENPKLPPSPQGGASFLDDTYLWSHNRDSLLKALAILEKKLGPLPTERGESGGAETDRGGGNPPDAIHVYKAQRSLRQLLPFLDGEMRMMGESALTHIGEWIRAHWGESVQLLSSDEETVNPEHHRPEEQPQPEGEWTTGSKRSAHLAGEDGHTLLDLASGAASSSATFTRSAASRTEGQNEGGFGGGKVPGSAAAEVLFGIRLASGCRWLSVGKAGLPRHSSQEGLLGPAFEGSAQTPAALDDRPVLADNFDIRDSTEAKSVPRQKQEPQPIPTPSLPEFAGPTPSRRAALALQVPEAIPTMHAGHQARLPLDLEPRQRRQPEEFWEPELQKEFRLAFQQASQTLQEQQAEEDERQWVSIVRKLQGRWEAGLSNEAHVCASCLNKLLL
ncbi:unnamed protein product, partial [Symbiodinium microadriaticum]